MKPLKLFTLMFFVAALALPAITSSTVQSQGGITEAPTGFDNLSNGFVDQTTHEANEDVFAEQEFIEDGLGPVYNAQSCGECHQNPVTGGISQITELRAGTFNGSIFFEHAGGSLIHSRAIDATVQERLSGSSNVRAFRTSLNTLGDGFVECIDSNTLAAIANSRPGCAGNSSRCRCWKRPASSAPDASAGRISTPASSPFPPTPTLMRWA